MTVYYFKFDFEIGTLKKSPCRECKIRKEFPGCFPDCIDTCEILDQIQSLLAETRSVTHSHDR